MSSILCHSDFVSRRTKTDHAGISHTELGGPRYLHGVKNHHLWRARASKPCMCTFEWIHLSHRHQTKATKTPADEFYNCIANRILSWGVGYHESNRQISRGFNANSALNISSEEKASALRPALHNLTLFASNFTCRPRETWILNCKVSARDLPSSLNIYTWRHMWQLLVIVFYRSAGDLPCSQRVVSGVSASQS